MYADSNCLDPRGFGVADPIGPIRITKTAVARLGIADSCIHAVGLDIAAELSAFYDGWTMILTINCGSSTIKFQLFSADLSRVLARGAVNQIGEPGSHLSYRTNGRSLHDAHEWPFAP